jgi:hypothetical protein
VRSRATRLIVRAGRCRSSKRVFLQTRALATPSMQHRLWLRAASARALCGRPVGRRTERLKKPIHPLRSKLHERQAMRPAMRSFILWQALIRSSTFLVRQRMRHEQKSWHPEKTNLPLREPLNGRVITHQQRSARRSAVFPPRLPEAGAWESSFAISTPHSAPEGDQIPEARRGMASRYGVSRPPERLQSVKGRRVTEGSA